MTSKGRRRAMKRQATRVSMRRCQCGKVRSGSRAEAEHKYAVSSIRGGHLDRVRFYVCEFGSWHWTRSLGRRQNTGKRDTTPQAAPRAQESPNSGTGGAAWREGLTPEQVAWLEELSDGE